MMSAAAASERINGSGEDVHVRQVVAEVPRVTLAQAEAARALGVSEDHFVRHIRDDLRSIRSGRRVLYPVAELERWAERSAARYLETA
jgi:excisionase family DNA binding protein